MTRKQNWAFFTFFFPEIFGLFFILFRKTWTKGPRGIHIGKLEVFDNSRKFLTNFQMFEFFLKNYSSPNGQISEMHDQYEENGFLDVLHFSEISGKWQTFFFRFPFFLKITYEESIQHEGPF